MTWLLIVGLGGITAFAAIERLPPSVAPNAPRTVQWQDPMPPPPPGAGWPGRRHDGWGPPGGPYPPGYGYGYAAPSQPPTVQPCPDPGSSAVVEGPARGSARGGPLVAMPSNDCADLPNRNAGPQPYIGVDVQVGPLSGREPVRPGFPEPLRRGW